MEKQFVCKIDNKVFSSQKELVDHMLALYSMEDQPQGKATEIFNKLSSAFPFADITVEESDDKESGEYFVSMYWKEFDGRFYFFIGQFKNVSYGYSQYEHVEDAITHYQKFLTRKDEVINKLTVAYRPEQILIRQMYGGDTDSFDSILFEMVVGGKNYCRAYEFQDVDKFVELFRGYFENSIEGEVTTESNYANGCTVEYWVNNVPVGSMFSRAKRIRIEILEEKK